MRISKDLTPKKFQKMLPDIGKQKVWMHRKTGRLVEVFNGFLGPGIFYRQCVDDRPWSDETPGYFEDDVRWKPQDYLDLGDL